MKLDSAAAIRLRARMQPVAGPGAFVQPPTYVGAGRGEVLVAHHKRRIDGEEVHCTLIGSVAAMANRLEESLAAIRAEGFPLSIAEVHADVDGYPLHESTLTMPHRGADAIARSCITDGKPYMETEPGKALLCNSSNVLPLVKWHQTMLLLGGWFSPRAQGVRIPRALHCEVVAIGSVPCTTVGGRFDTTPASSSVTIYRVPGDGIPFEMKGKGNGDKPSKLPIGMIPSGIEERGVTADFYDLSAVLSLGMLRRLRCGEINPAPLHDALAWLGVTVLLRTVADGINLRSRCQLVPESAPTLEVVQPDGKAEPLQVSVGEARERAIEAIEACKRSGIPWGDETVRLEPSAQLRSLISQSLAVGAEE